MFISGLIITFHEDPALTGPALHDIGRAGAFTLGERRGPCVAAAMEAGDAAEARDWHEWLQVLPGVAGVEVVFVHWDEVDEVAHAGA